MTNRLGSWLGLASFYATSFTVLAVFMAFFPLWLENDRGIGEQEVAWVWSSQTIARMVAGPLWSQRVDRSGRPRQTILWLSLLSVAAFSLFWFVDSVPALIACGFVFGCCYPPVHSIQDALAMRTARVQGFSFSRVRAVGSTAFLIVVLAVGYWLDVAGAAAVYPILAVGLLVMVLGAVALPRDDEVRAPVGRSETAAGETVTSEAAASPLRALFRSRPFLLLLLSSGLIQGSHAVYYNYSAIHWQNLGLAESTTGQLWAEGVLAEIVLFLWARGSVERARPTTLLMIGGVLAAVRWCALGATASVPMLFAANWLHACSFGCTFLGALRAIEARVPVAQRSTAQGLHGAAAMGGGVVVAALVGGFLFERSPALAFYAMGGFALLGVVCALCLRRRSSTMATTPQQPAAQTPE
ncbi:MAG: MFS transporter [bacterium]|nr:MFS transporter [bacterium]